MNIISHRYKNVKYYNGTNKYVIITIIIEESVLSDLYLHIFYFLILFYLYSTKFCYKIGWQNLTGRKNIRRHLNLSYKVFSDFPAAFSLILVLIMRWLAKPHDRRKLPHISSFEWDFSLSLRRLMQRQEVSAHAHPHIYTHMHIYI